MMKALVAAAVFLAASVVSCAQAALAPFTWTIDSAVRPSQAFMVGLDGRAPDPLGAAADAAGHTFSYTTDELSVRDPSSAVLKSLTERYGAEPERTLRLHEHTWTLLRIHPRSSPAARFRADVERMGVRGAYRFSSAAAQATIATVARERARGIAAYVNFAMHGASNGKYVNETVLEENPDGLGGFVNFLALQGAQPWADPDGVVRAWDYLYYKGIVTCTAANAAQCPAWTIPRIAIADGGFPIGAGGAPLPGEDDIPFPKRLLQINLVDPGNPFVNGENPSKCTAFSDCLFHGTEVFGAAAAQPHNHFGAAGTSGGLASVMFIKVRVLGTDVATAIVDAARDQASVLNMSFGGECFGSLCGAVFDAGGLLENAIQTATLVDPGLVIVASAGNEGATLSADHDAPPCTLPGVICIGAVTGAGVAEKFSSTGPKVALFAPDAFPVTPLPGTIGDPGSAPLQSFTGTSAAAPFVSGIVALMKVLDPGLKTAQVQSILLATSAPRKDGPGGIVKPLPALLAISPNLPPAVQIRTPASGATIGASAHLVADVRDPEIDPKIDGIVMKWKSDKQGDLCSLTATTICDVALLPGAHRITVTATDGFGASAASTIAVNVVGKSEAFITYPPDGTTEYADHNVNLRGYGTSPTQGTDPATLTWTSNLGKTALGTGPDIWAALPQGDNVVTLTSANGYGSASASITIHVLAPSGYPNARIANPADGDTIDQKIVLRGSATDGSGGMLSGASLVWTSDVDGLLGTGNKVVMKRQLTGGACAPVVHHITLKATNAAGKSGAHTVTVYVGRIC